MSFNYSKLKGRIAELYGNQQKFARVIGMGIPTLSNKLNNKTGITQEEVIRMSKALKIALPDIYLFFYDAI